jgi:hypothetical protein
MTPKLRTDLDEMEALLKKFVEFCKTHGIPMVLAAGNSPFVDDVNANLPHKLKTQDDTMITVGAVDGAGKVWEDSIDDKDNLVIVFAPGTSIRVRPNDPDKPHDDPFVKGTNPATALVVCILKGLD